MIPERAPWISVTALLACGAALATAQTAGTEAPREPQSSSATDSEGDVAAATSNTTTSSSDSSGAQHSAEATTAGGARQSDSERAASSASSHTGDEAAPAGPTAKGASRATSVVGAPVYGSTSHEHIAQIEDLIIDRRGRVTLAVLALTENAASGRAPGAADATLGQGTSATGSDVGSGTARSRDPSAVTMPRGGSASGTSSSSGLSAAAVGASGRLHAVPWTALRYDEAMQHFVLEADASKLASAPSFSRADWPDLASVQWSERVYRHFGQRFQTAAAESSTDTRR